MVTVESLYLVALLSAFVGLIALMALSAPNFAQTDGRRYLVGVIVAAAIVSVGSPFLYALSPHAVARSVYGSNSQTAIQI
jgi:hypothetical protein